MQYRVRPVSYTHLDVYKRQVVANLEPAKVRGVESRGMLLAGFTEDRKELTLITVDKPVPNGSKVS